MSHEAAAALLDLDRSKPGSVEFTVLRWARRTLRFGRVHTTGSVGPLDVITVDGFRCASATKTIIDLAYAGVPPARLGPMIDSSVRLGRSAPRVLQDRLQDLRGPGRHGVAVLEALLVDSGGETPLERRFLELIRGARLPRPAPQ